MRSYTSTGTSSNRLLNGIAFYQMLGGAIGLILAIQLSLQMKSEAASSTLAVIIACVLYLFSFISGFLLLKKPSRYLVLSMVNQGLQILSFGYGKMAYNYVAGLKLGVGLNFLEEWVVKLRISTSSFQFTFNTDIGLSFVTVNLLAIVLLYLLEKAKDDIAAQTP